MYTIFEQLLQEKGVSTYKVSKETGIAQSVFSAWKNGISQPKQDKMQKIADYLGVSLKYLSTGVEDGKSDEYLINIDKSKSKSYERLLRYAMLLSENKKLSDTFDKYIALDEHDASHIDYMINAIYDSKNKADDK